MILCVDIGNSRIKWGSFDADGHLRAHGSLATSTNLDAEMRTLLSSKDQGSSHARALISCVAGHEVLSPITQLLSELEIPWTSMTTATQAAGVRNRYQPADSLGSDRWAALIGAWHQSRQMASPCQSVLVVNAGTALTVDGLLAEIETPGYANFVGGIIVPGYLMMQQSLLAGTAGIANALQKSDASIRVHHHDTLPCNTADAVAQGALLAMAGAVRNMFETLQEMASAPPYCMISGGDAALLTQTMQQRMPDARFAQHDHLVLQGLWALDSSLRNS